MLLAAVKKLLSSSLAERYGASRASNSGKEPYPKLDGGGGGGGRGAEAGGEVVAVKAAVEVAGALLKAVVEAAAAAAAAASRSLIFLSAGETYG